MGHDGQDSLVREQGSVVRETHISVLLLLGDRVLKFRKPLRFDFLDLTSLSAREEDCRREVDLNSRLAPDVYIGVADVSARGQVVDHAVLMRRLPADRSLAELVRRPEAIWGPEVAKVSSVLERFHARAQRSDAISAHATAGAVRDAFDGNVKEMRRFVGTVLDQDTLDRVVEAVHRYLKGRSRLFESRIDSGHICDGHGDLQASDIYCLADGPRILDCLQFDDALRCVDVVADLAFLAMDLDRLGSRGAAELLVDRYEQFAGEVIPRSLLDLYIALRAQVRTKVACIRHEQGSAESATEAAQLLLLALAHLERAEVRLVLVGGLPGTGKSTIAERLATAIGAEVIRSDEIRRATPGARYAPTPGYLEGRYSPETTRRVYSELLRRAAGRLSVGQSVVLDASWIDATQRRAAEDLAEAATAHLTELHCVAPWPVAERRIRDRLARGDDISEATVAVARAMALAEPEWLSAVAVDTSKDPEESLADALASLSGSALDRT